MSDEMPPLFQAILAQDHKAIRRLLADGASLGEIWQGKSPLSFAVTVWREGDTEPQKLAIARTLISCGAPLGLRNAQGETPAEEAAAAGWKDLSDFLLAWGVPAAPKPVPPPEVVRMPVATVPVGVAPPASTGGVPAAVKVLAGLAGAAALWFGGAYYGEHRGAAATPVVADSPTPVVASSGVSAGESYLAQATAAWARKDWANASISADLAAEFLEKEHGAKDKVLAAHKIAAQAYYKRKQMDKALVHYRALAHLNPADKQSLQIARTLSARLKPVAPRAIVRTGPSPEASPVAEEESAPPSINSGDSAYPTAAAKPVEDPRLQGPGAKRKGGNDLFDFLDPNQVQVPHRPARKRRRLDI